MGARRLQPENKMTVVSRKDATVKIKSSKTAEQVFRDIWQPETYKKHERAYMLCLGENGEVINHYLLNIGRRSDTTIDARSMVDYAIQTNAWAVILAHNHPSNNCNPSPQDISFTANLKMVFEMIETPLVDHIILTEDSYYSFADYGLLKS